MSPLKDKTVAVIGYGNQGRAQALNMRDSGVDVIVGVRVGGRSWKIAEEDGFKPMSIEEASRKADIIHILIPDTVQPMVYEEKIKPELKEGKTLGFSHGYNIHFKLIKPPSWVDVILIAPKSPGKRMRELYLNGGGVPALVAVGQDYSGEAMKKALAMAKAIGCSRVGVIETTFAEETETDLFGEQTVLVGGVMELIKKGFEVLVEEGYQPEISYFEVCNELKLIVDLIYREGLSGMLKAVSETARYGGLTIGPKIIDESVKERMKEALRRIRSGEFEKSWTGNPSAGELLKEKLEEIKRHPIESVGKKIRKLMGFGEG
ncbi:MAG TPA: ketol-acid reductoisomerase [Nitrososphaeria archaeon]|nr:MAG: ketol-acid reductoisomerase [Nitrososphaerota archaeon]HDJ66659.1 ketol-acid reductoisomerase [Nitrososphaeria archaeon]